MHYSVKLNITVGGKTKFDKHFIEERNVFATSNTTYCFNVILVSLSMAISTPYSTPLFVFRPGRNRRISGKV